MACPARRSTPPSPDTELLVDQPYEDRKTVRVTGRFTVESLSPHGVLDPERPPPSATEAAAASSTEATSFEQTIIDNLRKAGVHNTFKGEEIRFDRLDAFAGTWIQAKGEFTDADSQRRRVRGEPRPRARNLGSDHVKEAAKEAMRGAGFDLLVVCGFSFDPHTGETAREFAPSGSGFEIAMEERRLGPLRILLARMNPDLAMGGELLKKTGAGTCSWSSAHPTWTSATSTVRSRSGASTCTTRQRARCDRVDRRNRMLVRRQRLQRRELLRPPRLIHRYQRPLRAAPPGLRADVDEDAMVVAVYGQPPVPRPQHRLDRRKGHQPLRRRGALSL